MNYKNAIAKVKQYFPNAVLSSKEIKKEVKTKWKGGDGISHVRTTTSVSHLYFVTDGGIALLPEKHWMYQSKTKAQAWIAAANFMKLPYETPDDPIQKSWPLHQAWMKRKKTKQQRIAKSKAKVARYGRVLTGGRMEVV